MSATKPSLFSWTPCFVSLETNEFVELFPSKEEAIKKRAETTVAYKELLLSVDKMIQDVTLLTLNPESQSTLAFLPQLADQVPGQTWLDLATLDTALKERLLLRKVRRVGPATQKLVALVLEPKPLVYLFKCYKRCCLNEKKENDEIKKMQLDSIKSSVLRKSNAVLNNPREVSDDLYSDETIGVQVMKLVGDEGGVEMAEFLENSLKVKDDHTQCCSVMKDVFNQIKKTIGKITLATLVRDSDSIEFLTELSKRPETGADLVMSSFPSDRKSGREWEQTLLGQLFSISVIPTRVGQKPDFFYGNAGKMLISDYRVHETNAFSNADIHFSHLFSIMENLLRCGGHTRHLTLSWLAGCLKSNQARRSEMAQHGETLHLFSSSAMFLNMSRVLVQFTVKFLRDPMSNKVLTIPPDYFVENKGEGKGSQMAGYDIDATLIAVQEEQKTTGNHGILSDFYFMAHCAIDLSFNQALKDIRKIEKDIREIRECEAKLKDSGEGKGEFLLNLTYPRRVRMLIRTEQELEMMKNQVYTMHACIRTATMNRTMRENLNTFMNASTLWLVHQCRVDLHDLRLEGFSAIPSSAPGQLSLVPEFLFENLYNFLHLENTPPVYGKYKQKVLSGGIQSNMISLLTVFMSTTWVKNPHLRAKFGTALSLLLPEINNREDLYRSAALLQPEVDSPLLQPANTAEADGLFGDVVCKKELVLSIFNVFVTLEVTGDSMQFESKFNARYPLNFVLFYLLKMEDYRLVIQEIAREAHDDMANQQPPVFLKFVNALINDGIWLLDEALGHMKKVKDAEKLIESSSWQTLPDSSKEQKLSELKESQEMAKWLNHLSSDHIRMLEALSKMTHHVFTHSDMADRIATMLNFFLSTLTGKDRNSYRIKDLGSLQFNPKTLLMSLIRIYCQLSTRETFVMAISRDGRSYSPQLFEGAAAVLNKIALPQDVEEILKVARMVEDAAGKHEVEDDLTAEAPEEFLDPIMSTLMKEPVRLPSSRKIVDRSTIAKHLLSDEKDPFNREPLTLEMVLPEEELRNRIEGWVRSRTGRGVADTEPIGAEANRIEEIMETIEENVEILPLEINEENTTHDSSIVVVPEANNNNAEVKIYSGGHSVGGSKLLPRIRKDLTEIRRGRPDGIFVAPDEGDMTKLHVVITGPPDTPYAGGFFYFVLQCPPNYPSSPPKASLITTDGGRVRFNPNLYKNGKVCLSILGTWSGPGWSPALSLLQVILSIQSLMNEKPFHNEPGLEESPESDDPRSISYNEIIHHETVRVAFLDMVRNPPENLPQELHEEILGAAPRHLETHLAVCKRFLHLSGQPMRDPVRENKGTFVWRKLRDELVEYRNTGV